MEALLKRVAAEHPSDEKRRLKECLEAATEFVKDNGELPKAAPPLIFGKVPFCMLFRMFAEWNVKCPWNQGCNHTPCAFMEYAMDADTFKEAFNMKERGAKPKECRFYLYTKYTSIFHGKLGYKNRKQLPKCCTRIIEELFPRIGEERVGFSPF